FRNSCLASVASVSASNLLPSSARLARAATRTQSHNAHAGPDSDPRARWKPSVPANPARASLATGTANPTRVEMPGCLADRVGPERATRLKPASTAPHTY